MLDLAALSKLPADPRFTTAETVDLFVEAALLAPANAVRVSGLIHRRQGQPKGVMILADVRGQQYVLGEAGAHQAISLLCRESGAADQPHLLVLALQLGGALCEVMSIIAAEPPCVH